MNCMNRHVSLRMRSLVIFVKFTSQAGSDSELRNVFSNQRDNMKVAFVFIAVAIAAAYGFPKEWQQWKTDYNKTYNSEEEELHRFAVWKANKKYVDEHNSKASGFTLKMNKFADLDSKEFSMIYNGYKPDKSEKSNARPVYFNKTDLPDAVDWRNEGYVTPVKDQNPCSSCWSFSVTGALEGQHFNATGDLVSLSEQNLLDCSDNKGCNVGGSRKVAFQYVISNGGIDTERYYPYVGQDQKCKYDASEVGSNCEAYNDVLPAGSEAALQAAVATIGPISVVIDSSSQCFQLYDGGVYDNPKCSQTNLNHAVLVVGYDTTSDGQDYWIVKNSWGTKWGIEGYIWMSRNKDNQCGIAESALYPTVTA